MKSKSWFVALLAIGLVAACADSSQLVRQPGKAAVKLIASDPVYIAVPRDGVYGDENYPGSGLTTAQTLLSAFAKRARRVEIATSYQTYEDALKTARERGFRYFVYPTILHWENRATEWSGIPDRVEVKIEVLEVATDTQLDSGIIKGKSGWATLGGDHPQDLLPKPMEEFVASLYGDA